MHKRGALPLPVPTFAVVMADAISLASASPSGEVTVQEAVWRLCFALQCGAEVSRDQGYRWCDRAWLVFAWEVTF